MITYEMTLILFLMLFSSVTIALLVYKSKQNVSLKKRCVDLQKLFNGANAKIKEQGERIRGAGEKQLSCKFFTQTKNIDGFFAKKVEIKYLMQLFMGGIPVAQPIELKVDLAKEVDKAQVNKILETYAEPFVKALGETAVKRVSGI